MFEIRAHAEFAIGRAMRETARKTLAGSIADLDLLLKGVSELHSRWWLGRGVVHASGD
jgi:hypothetical protein